MIRRTVAVESDAYLSIHLDQLVVRRTGQPDATVPIEDLGVLVLDHAQTTVTEPLLAKLAAAGVGVVVCDAKHLPVGLCLPLAGYHQHAGVLRLQIAQSEPAKKRLWQQVVQAKVAAQAAALAWAGADPKPLRALVPQVQSGDTGNVEARAAVRYFDALFGGEFLRDSDGDGQNAWLNYGYTLLRAAVARALCGAGLHPALGIFHRNASDAFALADDLMEPLRPAVDGIVARAALGGETEWSLSPANKRVLLAVLGSEVTLDRTPYPLSTGLELYAAKFRACVAGEARRLACPMPVLPKRD